MISWRHALWYEINFSTFTDSKSNAKNMYSPALFILHDKEKKNKKKTNKKKTPNSCNFTSQKKNHLFYTWNKIISDLENAEPFDHNSFNMRTENFDFVLFHLIKQAPLFSKHSLIITLALA